MARKLSVLCIPDMHLPWVDWKAVEKIYTAIQDKKPNIIIQLGDLYDRFSFSRFAKTQDLMTPKQEIEEGREGAINFWKTVHKISPKARKIQLSGNHESRLLRQTLERFPEIYSIVNKADAELSKFSNVETIQDARDGIFIEDVLYIHGYLTMLGAHMKNLGVNVVHAHTHRAGTLIINHFGKTLFELDCGYLANPKMIPLQYGAIKWNSWIHGYGWVDADGPRFISLNNLI